MGSAFEVYSLISIIFLTDALSLQTRLSTTTGYGYIYLDKYGIPANGSTFITFQVQTCSNAHIALCHPPREEPIEIVIDGYFNSTYTSCIRLTPDGICCAIASEAVLNCREYRTFTVNWEGGNIIVKKGDKTASNSNILLSYNLGHSLCDVKVGISTGSASLGNWVFEDSPSSVILRSPTSIDATSPAPVIASVGVVLPAGLVIVLLLSLKYCKKNEQSTDYETNTNLGTEIQDGMDQVNEHQYDALSVTLTHTYLELCEDPIEVKTVTQEQGAKAMQTE